MKLSTAIRLGSMLKPQAFRAEFDGVGTCANGAAKDAIGKLNVFDSSLEDDFPLTSMPWRRCPVCASSNGLSVGVSDRVGGNIAHLNDTHRWSRERIADWVEQIEQSLESQVSRVLSPGEEEKEYARVDGRS